MKQIIVLITGIFFMAAGVSAQKNSMAEVKIKTSAQCDMCKKRIEDGLYSQKGIVEATLNVETKILTVKYRSTKTTDVDIRNYVSSLGYDADDIAANKTAYEQLPGCCQAEGMK